MSGRPIQSALLSACLTAVTAACTGCNPASETNAHAGQPASRPAGPAVRCFVTIPPQAYFVERIGGPHVKVSVLVSAGQSPHTYEATPQQRADLERSDLYFTIDLPAEARLQRVLTDLPHLRVVDTCAGLPRRHMGSGETCSGGEHHDHHHDVGEVDPHTWLSPRLAERQAAIIRDALVQADPAHAADYRKNCDAVIADLKKLDAEITHALAPYHGREFFVYHPAFGYFGDAYGLKQVAVELDGKEPAPRQLARLIEKARRADVRIIFVQAQFPVSAASVVAREIGGAVVALDPLDHDYLNNMRTMADRLADALRPQTALATQP